MAPKSVGRWVHSKVEPRVLKLELKKVDCLAALLGGYWVVARVVSRVDARVVMKVDEKVALSAV